MRKTSVRQGCVTLAEAERTCVPGVKSMSRLNVSREDQPAAAQASCKGAPLDSALEGATLLVTRRGGMHA